MVVEDDDPLWGVERLLRSWLNVEPLFGKSSCVTSPVGLVIVLDRALKGMSA